jgi:anti-sigma regulatory factor (Ser/Thr protein kinase)
MIEVSSIQRFLALDAVVMRLSGELGRIGAETVRHALYQAWSECPTAVIVDFSAVRVTDPGDLACLRLLPDDERPGVVVMACGLGAAGGTATAATALGDVTQHASEREALRLVARLREDRRDLSLAIEPVPAGVTTARRFADDACANWAVDELRDPVRLIVSELVTNAIVHAGGEIWLDIAWRPPFLHIRVRDRSLAPPRLAARADAFAVRGRGLPLVERASSAWGHQNDLHGKVVWAMIRRGQRQNIG